MDRRRDQFQHSHRCQFLVPLGPFSDDMITPLTTPSSAAYNDNYDIPYESWLSRSHGNYVSIWDISRALWWYLLAALAHVTMCAFIYSIQEFPPPPGCYDLHESPGKQFLVLIQGPPSIRVSWTFKCSIHTGLTSSEVWYLINNLDGLIGSSKLVLESNFPRSFD